MLFSLLSDLHNLFFLCHTYMPSCSCFSVFLEIFFSALNKLFGSVAFFLNVQVFEAFGQVELVQLPLDETGHCKGFGFVQVRTSTKSLNGSTQSW